MSDKTPKDGYDDRDPFHMGDAGPDPEGDVPGEQEQSVSFDEQYSSKGSGQNEVGGAADQWQKSWAERAEEYWAESIPAEESASDKKQDKEDAVFAALRKKTAKNDQAPAQPKGKEREEAVFAALQRRTKKTAQAPAQEDGAAPQEAPAPQDRAEREAAVFAAISKRSGKRAATESSKPADAPKTPRASDHRPQQEQPARQERQPRQEQPARQERQPRQERPARQEQPIRRTSPVPQPKQRSAEPAGSHGSVPSPVPQEDHKPVRKRKRKYPVAEKDPVTIGRDLRADQILVYDSELDEVDYTDAEDLPEWRDHMPVRFRRYGRSGIGGGILYGLCVISISIILACLAWVYASDVLALNKEEKSAIVVIDEYEPTDDMPTVNENGDEIQVDMSQVATALKNAGLIEYKWLFEIYGQMSHAETKIDPGTYALTTALDYRALVSAMQFGSGSQEETLVTFPEGYTEDQIFALLEENNICKADDLYEAAANYDFAYDFLEDLEVGDPYRLEGYLFPDTYYFYSGEAPEVTISRFLNNTANKIAGMSARAASMGYTLHDIIIIASIIEREAGSDDERATMASVIYNRLNAGWKLQLDSTLYYVLGTGTTLTYDDLELDSPYNTYLYDGLPAGPICNPGLASIEAALSPESTNYWYWYSYEGVTSFFTNLDDFNAFAASHSGS